MVHFNGDNISSGSGGLLLQQTERITGIISQFADCFDDHRNLELIEHTVGELIAQRIYALALGYEDLNDHGELRNNPLLAVLVGKKDPTGKDRVCKVWISLSESYPYQQLFKQVYKNLRRL